MPRTSCLHLNNLYTTPLEDIYKCRFKRHLYYVLFLDKYFISLKKKNLRKFNVFVKSIVIDLLPRTSCLHLNNLYTTPLECVYTCRFKRHLYHVLFLDKYFISLKKNIWKLNFNVFVKSIVVNLDVWKGKMFEKKWIFKRWYSILLSFITVKHLSAQNFQIFNILK